MRILYPCRRQSEGGEPRRRRARGRSGSVPRNVPQRQHGNQSESLLQMAAVDPRVAPNRNRRRPRRPVRRSIFKDTHNARKAGGPDLQSDAPHRRNPRGGATGNDNRRRCEQEQHSDKRNLLRGIYLQNENPGKDGDPRARPQGKERTEAGHQMRRRLFRCKYEDRLHERSDRGERDQ